MPDGKERILLFSLGLFREELCQTTNYSVPLQQYLLLTRGNRSGCRLVVFNAGVSRLSLWGLHLVLSSTFIEQTNFSSDVSAGAADEA